MRNCFLFIIGIRVACRVCVAAIAILAGCCFVCSQTRADMELSAIINSGDLFRLESQYPSLKDSVSMKMLNLVAEAQLGVGFNRLESAEAAMDSLLLLHRDELGEEAVVGIAALRAMNLLNMGQYQAAGKAGEDLVNALKDVMPFESLYSFVFIERVGKALCNAPSPYLVRPSRDVAVPMRCDSVGRGRHIYIPVEVNGITKDYIFDTGCSFGNFVSEKYAEEVGLRIVADSIPVSGMKVGYVKLAMADSLKIGELVYHNPVFMVAANDEEVDSVFTLDGVLGYHFLRDVKEVVIDNEGKRFVFPNQISCDEPNMFFSSNVPSLRIEYGGQPFNVVFDTGNAKSDLGNEFVKMFPAALSGLFEHTTGRGGFGGISHVKAVTLPEFQFKLSGVPVTLYDTEVVTSDEESMLFSGSLGTDFVLAFKRLVINYENMFVKGE